MTKAISIVMSCYNEEKNLKRGVLEEVYQFLSKQEYAWEVVITNDKSTDNSLKLLKDFAKKHPNFSIHEIPQKGGKPGGIWYSIQKAKHPIILMTDVDQSTPISEVKKLLPYFNQNYDIVIGSRGTTRHGFSLLRKLGSKIFLSVRKFIMLPGIVDTQCGFKAMKTSAAKAIFPHLEAVNSTNQLSWKVTAYDVELLFIAQKWNYKIKEVPVNWRNEDISDTKGDFNARYKKESIEMAQQIWKVKKNDLKGKYEK